MKVKQGLYETVINKELSEAINKLQSENYKIETNVINEDEAHIVLSKYIEGVVKDALIAIREDRHIRKDDNLINQIELCNELVELMYNHLKYEEFSGLKIPEKAEMLMSVYSKLNSIYAVNEKIVPLRPATSIARSSLFTGSRNEPELVSELRREINSSNRIDMLISFVKWSGLRLIYDDIKEFIKKEGNKIRIITTCYMGATDVSAIERLAKLNNVEVKISYNTKHTRLHAKSYLFYRDTGYTTAYIGSSNMSRAAMTSGLEWNLKVTEKDSWEVIKKFKATFDGYWNQYDFETYDPNNEKDKDKLKEAISNERNYSSGVKNEISTMFNIRPYAYQQDILDRLKAEREIFGRNRNLVVAATGVGKTVIAAFDYKGFIKKYGDARLLFVSHREEILKQSMATFRAILKDRNFGELLTGKCKAENIEHLFITINSFNSKEFCAITSPDYYDFIIIDEFHHAAAPSYQKLLSYYEPKVLLGLTATPERMDNKNILKYFDHKIASEMRLPEAINHKLLVPFHYFCVTDEVDLSGLKWSNGGYQANDLANIYNLHHDTRVRIIIDSMKRYLTDMTNVKAIGFCVTVEHARAMAKSFNQANIDAIAVVGNTEDEIRSKAKSMLEKGSVKVVFTVNVYNEGVDIPCINTVLFLRPTKSLTVFLQQLGRGLRHDEKSDKECLTVLDYVGQAHANYSYEEKFRALLHHSNRSIWKSVKSENYSLPRGCHIKMEKVARDYILENIKDAIINKKTIMNRMRTFESESGKKLELEEFLDYYNMNIKDFYGKEARRSFYSMLEEIKGRSLNENYNPTITTRYSNLFFIDSKEIIESGIKFFKGKENYFEDEKILAFYYYSFYVKVPKKLELNSMLEGLINIKKNDIHCKEIIDILEYKYKNMKVVGIKQKMNIETPLEVYGNYTRFQILAGLGYYNESNMPLSQAGVLYLEENKTDIFFITLNKSEKEFSEATMYEDYPMNEKLFHWQSQHKTGSESKTAKRYFEHDKTANDILLFVRQLKKKDSPYMFLGKAHHVSHEGTKPVSIIWRLEDSMPAWFLEEEMSLVQ